MHVTDIDDDLFFFSFSLLFFFLDVLLSIKKRLLNLFLHPLFVFVVGASISDIVVNSVSYCVVVVM